MTYWRISYPFWNIGQSYRWFGFSNTIFQFILVPFLLHSPSLMSITPSPACVVGTFVYCRVHSGFKRHRVGIYVTLCFSEMIGSNIWGICETKLLIVKWPMVLYNIHKSTCLLDTKEMGQNAYFIRCSVLPQVYLVSRQIYDKVQKIMLCLRSIQYARISHIGNNLSGLVTFLSLFNVYKITSHG